MDTVLFVAGFLVVAWALARWGTVVADKVPNWLTLDWKHQAETFLAEQHTVMNPDHVSEVSPNVAAPPNYSWWSPKAGPSAAAHTHTLWWLPLVGPLLEKKYRHAWSELWVVSVSTLMALLVLGFMGMNTIVGLNYWRIIGGVLLIAWLQTLSSIDHKTQFLPDMLTYPLLWLGLLWAVIEPGLISPAHAVEGAIMGYMTLWSLGKAFYLLRGQDGMGGGDMKLVAALGAWVGPLGIMLVIGVAAFIGLGHAIVLAARGKGFNKFAFGPSLATAAILVYTLQPILFANATTIK